MHCTNCGAALDDGSRFCPACGAPVSSNVSEPVQTARQPAQPQYVQQPQVVVVTKPVRAPKAPSNGPAVAGLVFNILVLAFLLLSVFSARGSHGDSDMLIVAAVCVLIGLILYIFAFIFGIIGFVKGLKHKVRLVVGIIAFVLIL